MKVAQKPRFEAHVSKWCWVADVLTLTRFIVAAVILKMAFTGGNTDLVFWLAVYGEITDAADGILARKLLYPNDGQGLWWRDNASEIDKAADLPLWGAMALYDILQLKWLPAIAMAIVVPVLCLLVELSLDTIERRYGKTRRTLVVLLRRGLYVYTLILLIEGLFQGTSWFVAMDWWGVGTWILPLVLTIVIAVVKRDRATQEKTKTPTLADERRRNQPRPKRRRPRRRKKSGVTMRVKPPKHYRF